jgi:hypothetical protein
MGDSVDTHTVRTRKHLYISDILIDQNTPVVVADQPATFVYRDDSSRLYHLYSQCRNACADPSGIRVVAASALILGCLLATAPAALAPVGLLFSTAPAALPRDASKQGTSTSDEPTRDDPTTDTGDPKDTSDVPHRSNVRSTALITWEGTSQALKCSYGLLFEGNTRGCQ